MNADPAGSADSETNTADRNGRRPPLTPEQRAAAARELARRRRAAAPTSEPIPRRTSGELAVLSFSQELLWLLDQVGEGGWAYNAPETVRLRGTLDRVALQQALDAVVARNEILRTTYELGDDGVPRQRIHPPSPVDVVDIDVSDIEDADERLAQADGAVQVASERPFDLAHDPQLRAVVVRIRPDDHLLLIVVHHIAIDGSSRAPLWRQISTGYNQLVRGATEVDLGPETVQYADFAEWQRRTVADTIERDLAYWREQLAGAPQLLDLPTDRPRPPIQSFRGAHDHLTLPPTVLGKLKDQARQHGATLFMATLAAIATFLHRVSGQDDVIVGTPVANRNHVDLTDMLGYFANTLALRTRFDDDPSFATVLDRVRTAVVDGFRHQEAPFGMVVNDVAPDRDPSRLPIFQVLLVLHTEERALRELDGLEIERHWHERGWSKFDLTFGMGEHPEGLHCSLEYSTDLWDADSIARLHRQFATLVTGAVADPDRPVSQLHLLDERERTTVVTTWNAPRVERPDVGLHQLVEEQAARSPDAVAIEHDGVALTYSQLLARAAVIEAALARAMVERAEPVGIATGRAPDLVAGLLAVLRHGAVCLPLDPDYPADRLNHMLHDSGARVVLASRAHSAVVPAGTTCIDLTALAGLGDSNAVDTGSPVRAHGVDPAYLIYTSGSTGLPKGVLLPHRGLVNHAVGASDVYAITAADRVLQLCSPSFDISVEEIFPTLARGGTVVIAGSTMPFGGRGFGDWLEANRVTFVNVPTAFWHEWVRDLETGGYPLPATVRAVVVGGEKANAAAYATWCRIARRDIRWFNTYGPTEASVIATVFEPAREGFGCGTGRDLPIGRPIPNCPVYVLDRAGAPVPIGGRGELHIGGAGVALGYVNEPELTAQKFVPNTVDGTGGRLYRTGDVARWLPDGTLAFVGRVDHQVKIRGFRVEPAEVASAIARHPAVAEVAVVARHDGADASARLVGYVTCVDRIDAPTAKELRRFTAGILPAYMTPSTIVVLDALPRTPNGKVDTDALPAPPVDDELTVGGDPRDPVEQSLLTLWRKVLDRDDIGVFDDFFDAGGHSLLAVRMFGGIERDFGRRLPLAALITAPTVAQLAEVLRDETPLESRQLVTLREGTNDIPIFFVHGPMGEAIIYLELARRLAGDHPVHAFQDRGLDRSHAQYPSIVAMAATYVEEVRRRQSTGPFVLGGFCMGGVVAYEMANQLRERGERVAVVLLIDAAPLGHLAGGRVYTTRGRIKTHLQEFASRRGRDRVDHVWETTTNVFDRVMRPTWWRFVKTRYLDHGRPLPRFFHDVEAVNWRLATDYIAPAYTGRVALLRELHGPEPAADRYRREMWASLVEGGEFSVHDIESDAVTHMTLLKEPHVRLLAREMDAAIAAALTAERARQG